MGFAPRRVSAQLHKQSERASGTHFGATMLATEGDVLPKPAMERRTVFNIWTTQMEALLGKTVKLLG